MDQYKIDSLTDGLRLNGRVFCPNFAPQDCRAVISLVHGFSEHSGRYAHIAKTLNETGIALNAIDLRGHGLSEGKRGHISNFSDFYGDVDALVKDTRQRFPDIPHFVMGHSMGGSIVLNYKLTRDLPQIMGYIATGPLLRLAKPAPEILRPLMMALRTFMPNLTFGKKVSGKDISTLPSEAKAYEDDPLIHGKLSPALALDMIDYGASALARADQWKAPLLLMHGEADAVTDCAATIEFKSRSGPDTSLRTFEKAYHEIHNDICRKDVYNDIINFVTTEINSRDLANTYI
ncbi:MAG: lysophospholipase [Maricaulaceae bacterium]